MWCDMQYQNTSMSQAEPLEQKNGLKLYWSVNPNLENGIERGFNTGRVCMCVRTSVQVCVFPLSSSAPTACMHTCSSARFSPSELCDWMYTLSQAAVSLLASLCQYCIHKTCPQNLASKALPPATMQWHSTSKSIYSSTVWQRGFIHCHWCIFHLCMHYPSKH